MNSLQALWNRETCPIVNGVLFPTGEITPIEVERLENGTRRLRRGEDTSMSDLEKGTTVDTTFYTEMCEATDEQRDLAAIGGGAGMGGDGFVAAMNLARSELKWVAFFDFANPFVEIAIAGESLTAHNELGESWCFPLSDPGGVSIVPELTITK